MASADSAPLIRTRIVRFFTSRAAKAFTSLAMLAAALVVLASNYDLSAIGADLGELTASAVAIISLALLANALLAVVRFTVISTDMGHPVPLQRAMATVSAGSLAGALFLQP